MRRLLLLFFIVSVLPATAFQAPGQATLIVPKDVLNHLRLAETAVFQQFYKGEPSGSMVLSREVNDGQLTIRDKTLVPVFKVAEELVSVVALADGGLTQLTGDGYFGKAAVDVALNTKDGVLSGHVQMGDNRREINQPLSSQTFSRVGLFALLPLFPFEAGKPYQAQMLDSLDGRVYTIEIGVTAVADGLRVELNGHKARQAFFISAGKTQRIEVLDTTWRYERVANEAALQPAKQPEPR
ncbi:hypothetical protein [Acanthopleuribacter pedis]|uniref:Secreted protein n=1 Tax=Acanthopleuribacter pedis TaxID=442870 RepID=A0A8J7QN18_9BACT|nr:hypothetical protein [Acanthopleuribacter pedis]MBO1321010.1 hypothetical protein [Acanthopleuribacter pedis]